MRRTNTSHVFIHMERARVRGLVSEAKFIPRGIAGNGFDGGGVNCTVIKLTYIFHGLGSIVDQGMFRNTT